MYELGYKPCEVDKDIWMKANYKMDIFDYYEYILIYSDGVLAVSHKPRIVMDPLHNIYQLKEPPAEPERDPSWEVQIWQWSCWIVSVFW